MGVQQDTWISKAATKSVLVGDVGPWEGGRSELGTATMVGKWALMFRGMSPAPLLLLSLDVWVWRYAGVCPEQQCCLLGGCLFFALVVFNQTDYLMEIDWLIDWFNFIAKTAVGAWDTWMTGWLWRWLSLPEMCAILWVRALLLSCGQNGQELVICLSLLEIEGLSSWAGCNEQVTLVESGTGRQPQL